LPSDPVVVEVTYTKMAPPISTNTALSHIKNKEKRAEVYAIRKAEKSRVKTENRRKRKREAEELGADAPAKQQPKTLDNTREEDFTVVEADDEEVAGDEAFDEFAKYFDGSVKPKIMLTTRPRPSKQLFKFISELMQMIPNAFYYKRESRELKKMSQYAANKGFTHLVVLGEKLKVCNQMMICHLPEGPTALFKVCGI
jgi:ribosome production factor 1